MAGTRFQRRAALQRFVREGEGPAMAYARMRNDMLSGVGKPPYPVVESAAYFYRACLQYGYDLGPR